MTRTLLDNTSRWTRSYPNFDLVPGALGEFDGVFRSQFSRFTYNRFSLIKISRYTTHLCRLLQCSNGSFLSIFLRLLVGLSFCLNMSEMTFVAIYTTFFQICSSDTQEDAKTYTTSYYNFYIDKESDFSCQNFPLCRVVLRQSVLPLNGMQEKSIVLVVSDC